MARYKIVTLVDITRSHASRTEINPIKIGQQANFNSLVQAIGLRANIDWTIDPRKHTGALPLPLVGKATHWIWEFVVERDDVFMKDNDPVGLLKDDLHLVPVVNQLNNSIDIHPAVFQTSGEKTNIWISNLD